MWISYRWGVIGALACLAAGLSWWALHYRAESNLRERQSEEQPIAKPEGRYRNFDPGVPNLDSTFDFTKQVHRPEVLPGSRAEAETRAWKSVVDEAAKGGR